MAGALLGFLRMRPGRARRRMCVVRPGLFRAGWGRVPLGEVSLKISTFNGKPSFEVLSQRKES